MEWKQLSKEFPWSEQIHRPKGLHVKDIINCMAEDYGITKYKDNPIAEEQLMMMAELGFWWENKFQIGRPRPIWIDPFTNNSGNEIKMDNYNDNCIWLSPDGIEHKYSIDGLPAGKPGCEEPIGIIHEYKVKRISCDRYGLDDLKWWDTIAQIKAYCYAFNCKKAELHVLHDRGNYKTELIAYRAYSLEFTEQELVENWQSIINYAKHNNLINEEVQSAED